MEFKKLSDSELASVMVNYINRIEHLRQTIARYLDCPNRGNIKAERIKAYYKELKNELRNDAEYLKLVCNRKGSGLYMGKFSQSIQEAAAWGFMVAVNSAINQSMYSAVDEAHHKLTKYYTLEEWGGLM